MVGKDLEKKRLAIKKFDPALAAIAIRELVAAKRIEKADVEKAKEKIKEIYKTLPATKDRTEIIARALDEVNSEMVTEEIKKIKAELADLNKDELMEIGKDLSAAAVAVCPSYLIGCPMYGICCGCIRYCLSFCLRYCLSRCLMYCLNYCLMYRIGPPCPGGCINYGICTIRMQFEDCGPAIRIITPPGELEIDPAMKEKIVEAVIDDPRLSKAMRKLVDAMKKRGEI